MPKVTNEIFGIKIIESPLPEGVVAIMLTDDAFIRTEFRDAKGNLIGVREEIKPEKILICQK